MNPGQTNGHVASEATTVQNAFYASTNGKVQKSGQVRRPASDTPSFAARGEREADQHQIIGLASQSLAVNFNVYLKLQP